VSGPPVGIARVAARSRTGEVGAQVVDLRRHREVAGRAQGFGAMVIHVASLTRRRPQQVAGAVTLAAAKALVGLVLERQCAHQRVFPHGQVHGRRYEPQGEVCGGFVARRTGQIAHGIVMAGGAELRRPCHPCAVLLTRGVTFTTGNCLVGYVAERPRLLMQGGSGHGAGSQQRCGGKPGRDPATSQVPVALGSHGTRSCACSRSGIR
jgi:hypothetical protein